MIDLGSIGDLGAGGAVTRVPDRLDVMHFLRSQREVIVVAQENYDRCRYWRTMRRL
jgi:hypothetical protein